MYLDDMKFTDTHEWVKVDGENEVTVGITQHAQELLGDLVYLELPAVAKQIQAHDIVGVVESVKAASDLYSPVSGEVIAINEAVIAEPALVNNDPHNSGWLFKVKLHDLAQLASLMSVTEYQNAIGQ
ncbi:MAG: glycine cleavage system protein GcvH [Burkholderiales bacterium]